MGKKDKNKIPKRARSTFFWMVNSDKEHDLIEAFLDNQNIWYKVKFAKLSKETEDQEKSFWRRSTIRH